MRRTLSPSRVGVLALGLAFLYLPILILVVWSFNDSRLVTVWGGFSLRWYRSLLENSALLQATGQSLLVALTSALLATGLGTAAALSLDRGKRFPGRTLFSAALYAPLVMPEIMTGLSLLLFFVAIGLDRGFWTVTIAHTSLTTSFVAVVVKSKLAQLDPLLGEAASDLGASPARVLLRVTLPLIVPAIITGFLLAFTLSLDDLVLASFTAGPGSSTLPMRIYSQVRLGVTPEINAISTLMIAAVAILLVASSLLGQRQSSTNNQ